jgi:hypothetical protein
MPPGISSARGYIEPLLRGEQHQRSMPKPPRHEYKSFEKENHQGNSSYSHDQEIDNLLKSTLPQYQPVSHQAIAKYLSEIA